MKLRVLDQIGAQGMALILILFSNVCFYNLDTQIIYIVMNLLAGVLVVLTQNLKSIKNVKPIIWLTGIFALFIVYGIFSLKAGTFNADRFIISYLQCILYYIIFKNIVLEAGFEKKMAYIFGVSALLCILTMYIQEGSFLGRELRSVGSSMAGNVNTVGMSLGIMSLFIVYYFGKTKKKSVLIFAITVMSIMMLTGSKKTIIYIIANIFILYSLSKNKFNGIISMILLFSFLAYLIFGVDYFYNMLGSRIIDMLGQMGFHIKNAHYSHSTEVRMYMINEAFDMWLQNPLFGGGTHYFQANTKTMYEYSHCNVTELLCSFGIVGFILYYIPHLSFFKSYKRISSNEKDIANFGFIITILTLIIDWMAVTYSGFSTMYIPIIFCLAIKEKRVETDNLNTQRRSYNYLK
nr:O-antigen ligase family protein [uncultured Acetatifactor sp.]